MRRPITAVTLFVIFFAIDLSSSAIFWYFKTTCIEDYTNSRKENFHRGLFLSFSTAQKQLLCEDQFSAQLYIIPKPKNTKDSIEELITDGQETEREPQHPLIVSQISLTGNTDDVEKKPEIFIKCFGTKFDLRKPFNSGEFYVSYGFEYGRWFVSTWLEDPRGQKHIILGQNMGTSPQHVSVKQPELEQQYSSIRKVMEVLQKESPAYVRLIETRDDLLALPKWHRAVLCASVLSSPIYRDERLEYSTRWILEHKNLNYEDRTLTLVYNSRANENTLTCECIICRGFANSDDEKSESTDLCITRSYDDRGSLYVIKLRHKFNFLDKYFKKVPILVNAEEPMAEDSLFKNYHDIRH